MKLNVLVLLRSCLAAVLRRRRDTAHPLHDDWQLQSACKATADGAAISAAGFRDGRLAEDIRARARCSPRRSKPASFPILTSACNLRNIPGTSYPIGHNFANLPMPQDSPYAAAWWYRKRIHRSCARDARDNRLWLHFGGINYRGEVWLNGKQHRRFHRQSPAPIAPTTSMSPTSSSPASPTSLAVKTIAPTEKDLGINWVDWNPCPPDKDMGLWGAVDLVDHRPGHRALATRSHALSRWLARNRADLTIYAELHNATAHRIKGIVSGTAAGMKFEQAGATCRA